MERHFKVGDQRNGREYYFWLLSLKVTDNGNDQVLLQQELFKLKLGSNALRDDYSRHLTTVSAALLFNLWTKMIRMRDSIPE